MMVEVGVGESSGSKERRKREKTRKRNWLQVEFVEDQCVSLRATSLMMLKEESDGSIPIPDSQADSIP